MMKEGLISSDSPRGLWEITEKGRSELERLREIDGTAVSEEKPEGPTAVTHNSNGVYDASESEEVPLSSPDAGDGVEIKIPPYGYYQKYGLIYVPSFIRRFFPGYKVPFVLETDIGPVTTQVTSSSRDTPKGHPFAGQYIQGGLRPWYRAHHEELLDGGIIRITCVEPYRRYHLSLIKTNE